MRPGMPFTLGSPRPASGSLLRLHLPPRPRRPGVPERDGVLHDLLDKAILKTVAELLSPRILDDAIEKALERLETA